MSSDRSVLHQQSRLLLLLLFIIPQHTLLPNQTLLQLTPLTRASSVDPKFSLRIVQAADGAQLDCLWHVGQCHLICQCHLIRPCCHVSQCRLIHHRICRHVGRCRLITSVGAITFIGAIASVVSVTFWLCPYGLVSVSLPCSPSLPFSFSLHPCPLVHRSVGPEDGRSVTS